jgi:hypothetical protein
MRFMMKKLKEDTVTVGTDSAGRVPLLILDELGRFTVRFSRNETNLMTATL